MLNHEYFIQALSLIGAIMVLSAYIGHQLRIKIFNPENYFYNLCNVAAGILLTYVAVETFQLGFIFMEGMWALVSAYTVFRLYYKKTKLTPSNKICGETLSKPIPANHPKMLLQENFILLAKAQFHLKNTLTHALNIPTKDIYSEQELEILEALTARFARLVDLLVKKSYNTLNAYELSEGGTVLEAIHKAQKRGLVNSLAQVKALEDVRKTIEHDYAQEKFMETVIQIKTLTPELIELTQKFIDYCQNLLSRGNE